MTFDASAFELVAEAKEGKKFGRPKPGSYSAVCSHIIDLWTSIEEWEDKKTWKKFEYEKKSFFINFAFKANSIIDNDDGTQDVSEEKQEFFRGKKYTLSFSNNSAFYKDVSSWLGSIPDNQKKAFKVFSLIGKPLLINIIEVKPKETKYSNIWTISSLPEGMPEYVSEVEHDWSIMQKGMLNEELFKYLPTYAEESAKNSKEYFEITGKRSLDQDEADIEAEIAKHKANSETVSEEVSTDDVEDVFGDTPEETKMP